MLYIIVYFPTTHFNIFAHYFKSGWSRGENYPKHSDKEWLQQAWASSFWEEQFDRQDVRQTARPAEDKRGNAGSASLDELLGHVGRAPYNLE